MDLVAIVNYILNDTPLNVGNADFDSSGVVTILDVISLANYIMEN